jgi:transglutaminase-like putative cysteine protease
MNAAAFLLVFGLQAWGQEPTIPTDDEALREAIAEAGTSEDLDGADLVTVLWDTRVEVEDSGLSHIRERQVIKCLTEEGAAALARLRFDWDPASNLVEVEKLRVLREDGEVEALPLDAGVDLPQPQHGIYWGARMRLVPLPRLDPGDAVEVATYMKGFLIAYLGDDGDDERYIPPMRGHFYDVVTFEKDHPVKMRFYEVRTPRDKPVQYEVYNGEVQSFSGFDATHHRYAFWKEDLPAFHGEDHAVDAPDVQTKVVMATAPDWPAKSRWFYQANEGQFEATPAIEAKVEEITAGLETDEDKVAAIVHWSADNIRYSGISMGEGEGYTLHPGPMIFEDRSGVCKDKAGMAITMMRAAGFETYAAMTMAGSRVERIPADQFNHSVVAWKRDDGTFTMLDPTWVVFSPEVWSSAEGEQHYVIGTEAGEELFQMPAFDPADNALVVEVDSTLSEGGDLTTSVTWTGRGYADQRLRREMVHYNTAHERDSWIEQAAARMGPGATVHPRIPPYAEIQDVYAPIALGMDVELPGYASSLGDQLWFAPPSSHHMVTSERLAPYLDAASPEEITQALLLWAPRMREVTETVTLPKGWDVVRLPEDRDLDNPLASLHTHTEVKGRKLLYTYRLVIKQREIPVEHYPGFREVVQEALDLPNDFVVLERR